MISPQPNEKINALFTERISAGDFPSAVYIVAEKDAIVFADALGYAVREPVKRETTIETIYDLASLTKPLVTGLLYAIFFERGLLDLDEPIGPRLTEFQKTEKNDLTFRQLLTHSTGLPAWRAFYLITNNDKEKTLSAIADERLEASPGKRVKYSDLSFIILGFALERMTGLKLNELAQQEIFGPLQLERTLFNPPQELRDKIAASETDNGHEKKMCIDEGYDVTKYNWREHLIWGEVHDGNAHFLGGVAGHAGLFSNVKETLSIALQFLPAHTQLLKPETCALFRQNMTVDLEEARSFAWQLASTKDSTAGPELSPDSFGHLGFTGTSLWIDGERDRVFVLFTNRTHDHSLPFVLINNVRRTFHTIASTELNNLRKSKASQE